MRNQKIVLVPTKGMSRETWLAYRYDGVGASEVGAVLGLDDYTSSLELYHLKIGSMAKFDVENMMKFMGREQEPFITRMAQHWEGDEASMIRNYQAGRVVRRLQRVNAYMRNLDYPWLFASIDRKFLPYDGRGPGNCEIKMLGGNEARKWEGGLPPKHITQVQQQLLVSTWTWGEMAVVEDMRKMFMLPFDPNASIMQTIVTRTKAFWDKVVAGRRLVNERYHAQSEFNQRRVDECNAEIDRLAPEPDGSLAYAEFLSERFKRPTAGVLFGNLEDVAEARAHRDVVDRIKGLEEEKRLHENRLKARMGTVPVLDFGEDGKVRWADQADGKRVFRNLVKVAS